MYLPLLLRSIKSFNKLLIINLTKEEHQFEVDTVVVVVGNYSFVLGNYSVVLGNYSVGLGKSFVYIVVVQDSFHNPS